MAVGLVVEHGGLSAAGDCAMVRKERVMNGSWGLRTKEDISFCNDLFLRLDR